MTRRRTSRLADTFARNLGVQTSKKLGRHRDSDTRRRLRVELLEDRRLLAGTSYGDDIDHHHDEHEHHDEHHHEHHHDHDSRGGPRQTPDPVLALACFEDVPIPRLNSRPSAKDLTVYLDFGGHFEPSWLNSFYGRRYYDVSTPPYSNDAFDSCRSQEEASRIETIWEGVSEAFSPFDVNVTTDYLAHDDTIARDIPFIRVVFGGNGEWLIDSSGQPVEAGGVAPKAGDNRGYITQTLFDYGGPAFQNSLYVNTVYVWDQDYLWRPPAYEADTAVHEVGHALGLVHQGAFETLEWIQYRDWDEDPGVAPFMGFSAYADIPRWSRGAIAPSGERNDEIHELRYERGIDLAPDDYPSHSRTVLEQTPYFDTTRHGILEFDDTDRFYFTAASNRAELTFKLADFRSMLYASVEVRDQSDGSLVHRSTLSARDGLDDGITREFDLEPNKEYFVQVRRAVDTFGNGGQYSVRVRPLGDPKIVGVPAQMAIGQAAELEGVSGFTERYADTFSYLWDLDGDGVFGESGANAANGNERGRYTTFIPSNLADGSTANVQLLLRDQRGKTTTISEQTLIDNSLLYAPVSSGLPVLNQPVYAWTDVEGDGDLDAAVTGALANGDSFLDVFLNDGDGGFTSVGLGVATTTGSSLTWADCDNDGDRDLLVLGANEPASILFRNDGGSFASTPFPLEPLEQASAAWADFDNDGDLDLLASGVSGVGDRRVILMKNDFGTFIEVLAPGVEAVSHGEIAWTDFDGDGDADFVIAGDSNNGPITRLYRNDGGVFSDTGISLEGVSEPSLDWGDFDQDGNPDLVVSGVSISGPTTLLYKNLLNNLVQVATALPQVEKGQARWGDHDNDGDLDLLLTGADINGSKQAEVYVNQGGAFLGFGTDLLGINGSASQFVDIDGDQDQDVVLAGSIADGSHIIGVHQSNLGVRQSTPQAPNGMSVSIAPSGEATFAWQPSNDAETPDWAVSYNLRVGTSPGGSEVMPAGDGLLGNVGSSTSWTLRGFEAGRTYYWSVESIDQSNGRSTSQELAFGEYFTPETNYSVPGVTDGDAKWADFNNDGRLDLVLIGETTSGARTRVFENTGVGLSEVATSLPDVSHGALDVGDFDRDGLVDILLTGRADSGAVAGVYRNSGSGFELHTTLTGVELSDAAWLDIDNDGDLDVAIVGKANGGSDTFAVYQNRNNAFEPKATDVPGYSQVSFSWQDIDLDGWTDLAIGGDSGGGNTVRVFRNMEGELIEERALGEFANVSLQWADSDQNGYSDLLVSGDYFSSLPNSLIYQDVQANASLTHQSLAIGLRNTKTGWADFDNDGDFDPILSGLRGATPTTQLFSNDFNKQTGNSRTIAHAIDLPNISQGGIEWADVDGDGDLDAFAYGLDASLSTVAGVYLNQVQSVNALPTAATGLNAIPLSPDAVTLNWVAGTDVETGEHGLTYALQVGTSSGGAEVATPMSAGPVRRTSEQTTLRRSPSNILTGLSWGETYYWSLQTIDSSFAASPMSAESSFLFNNAPTNPTLASTIVAENNDAGESITEIRSSDIDLISGDTLTFTLVSGEDDEDNGSFSINGNQLIALESFNYEVKSHYKIRVRATDALGASAESSLSISVTDINDAPASIHLSQTQVAENSPSARVGFLTTQDQDLNQSHSYRIISGNDAFELAGPAGNELRVRFGTSLDYETQDVHTIVVESTDSGSPALTRVETLHIDVIDVDEESIVFAYDVPQGTAWGNYETLDGILYFQGAKGELWNYDPVSESASMIDDRWDSGPVSLKAHEGKLYFGAPIGSVPNGHIATDWSLWSYEPATGIFAEIHDTAGVPYSITDFDGRLYYSAMDTDGRAKLWQYDEAQGATVAADFGNYSSGPSPNNLTELNGELYFTATDGDEHGFELWKLHPTSGVELVLDLLPGPSSSYLDKLIEFDGRLVFLGPADEYLKRLTLFEYDPASGQVMRLDPDLRAFDSSDPQESSGALYFSGLMYTTTGFVSGTYKYQRDAGITLVEEGLSARNIVPFANDLYFVRSETSTGQELWKIETGGVDSVSLVRDLVPGPAGSYPRDLLAFDGELYFQAIVDDPHTRTWDLWKVAGKPQAVPDHMVILEDTSTVIPVLANDFDPNEASLAVSEITQQPNFGTVVLNGDGSVVYTPQIDFFGSDSFQYSVSDGDGGSDTALVTIEVQPINDQPSFIASNPTSVPEDSGTVTIADWTTFDAGALNESVQIAAGYFVTEISNESLFANAPTIRSDGTLSYTAAADQNGTSTFVVLVRDKGGTANGGVDISPPQTFTISIDAVNDSPNISAETSIVAPADVLEAVPGVSITDADLPQGDASELEVTVEAADGFASLTLTTGLNYVSGSNGDSTWTVRGNISDLNDALTTLQYRSEQDYFGETSLTITVSDLGNRGSGGPLTMAKTVAISVLPRIVVPPGETSTQILRDGDDVVIRNETANEFFREPLSNVAGVVVVGHDDSETISINVDGLTGIELPYGIRVSGGEGTGDTDDLILNGSQALTNHDYTTGGPESGTITLDGLQVFFEEFEPIYDYLNVQNRSFQIGSTGEQAVFVEDDGDDSNGRMMVHPGNAGGFERIEFFLPTNSLEVVGNDEQNSIYLGDLEDSTQLLITLKGMNGDDSIDASNFNGTLNIAGGRGDDTIFAGKGINLIEGGEGSDSVVDGGGENLVSGGSGVNSFSSNGGVNFFEATIDEPIGAFSDRYSVDEDTDLNVPAATGVLANDSLPTEFSATVELVSLPSIGDITLNPNGSFTYQPGENVSGLDEFSYRIVGIDTVSDEIPVSIEIHPVNDRPWANDDFFSVVEDRKFQFATSALTDNDFDPDGDSLLFSVSQTPSNGELISFDDGSYEYVPNQHYSGADQFSYTLTDPDGLSAIASVDIIVLPRADAPVANDDDAQTSEDSTVLIDSLSNDIELDRGETLQIVGESLRILSATQAGDGTPIELNSSTVAIIEDQIFFDPGTDFQFLGAQDTAVVTVEYQIEDSADIPLTDTATVTIAIGGLNDTPEVEILHPAIAIKESQTAFNSGTLFDIDQSDSAQLTSSIGQISVDPTDSTRWIWSYTGTRGLEVPVEITATDSTGATSTATFELSVENVAPEASFIVTSVRDSQSSTLATVGFAGIIDASQSAKRFSFGLATEDLSDSYATASLDPTADFAFAAGYEGEIYGRIIDEEDAYSDYSINVLIGTPDSDLLTGTNDADLIIGLGKGDSIDGRGGADWIFAGGGDDLVKPGSGTDFTDAGDGNDTIEIRDNWSEFDTLIGANGFDRVVNSDPNRDLRLNAFLSDDSNWNLEELNGLGRKVLGNNENNAFDFSDVALVDVAGVYAKGGDDVVTASGFTHDVAYHGEAGHDRLVGLGKRDLLLGGDGNDSITAGGGDDTLTPGSGIDQVDAGAGNDTLLVRDNWSEFDTLGGGDGFDRVINSDANRDLRFDQFLSRDAAWNLELLDSAGRKVLGNNQANTLDFSDVQMVAVEGVYAKGANDVITASAFTHDVAYHGESGDDNLTGLGKRDVLVGGDGNDTITAGGGDDSITPGSGVDAIDAGPGNDRFYVRDNWSQFDVLIGGDGFDRVINADVNRDLRFNQFLSRDNDWNLELVDARNRKILGNNQANTFDFGDVQLIGTAGILAKGGNDLIIASAFTHDIEYHGEAGDDRLTGLGKRDLLLGGDGNDTILAGGGDDTVTPGSGADSVDAGSGNDRLHIRDNWSEFDVLEGGNGYDRVINSDANRDLRFNTFLSGDADWNLELIDALERKILGNNQANVLDFGDVQMVGVVGVFAKGGDDNVTSSAFTHDVEYHGEAGNDTLNGSSKRDLLLGGDGNDTINGGGGNDSITPGSGTDDNDGGPGNDHFYVRDNWSEFDTLNGGDGFDRVINTDANRDLRFDRFLSQEADWNLEFLDAANRKILGNNQANTLDFGDVQLAGLVGVFAKGGDDTLIASAYTHDAEYHGESGDDTLTGMGKRDILLGNDGNDTIAGGGGDDSITPGSGIDIVDAGPGNDRLYIRDNWSEYDTLGGGDGFDRVVNSDVTRSLRFNQFLSKDRDWNLELVDAMDNDILGNNESNTLDFSDVQMVRVTGVYARGGADNVIASAFTHDIKYYGESGDDSLTGLGKRDHLDGGDGDDTLMAGGGEDLLIGGRGINLFAGGSGNDLFILARDSANQIADFNDTGDDRIKLRVSPPENGSAVALFSTTDADGDGEDDDLSAELWHGIDLNLVDAALSDLDDADFFFD